MSVVRRPTRPNIDVSWGTNGGVEDFALKHDMTLSEAYEFLLECGLRELGDDPEQSTFFAFERSGKQCP